jgi:hypothetical protein
LPQQACKTNSKQFQRTCRECANVRMLSATSGCGGA